ncbi:MAG: phosphate acetyltransferase [Flavobacteriaceae bacterium]|nr:phosphate acetyltransferase [Flavobacteriaceae bacterium]
MNKGLYIATLESHSGKSLITLGLLNTLIGKTPKVGYFRPVVENKFAGVKDNHIDTVLSHFKLDLPYEETYGLTRAQIIKNRNAQKIGESLDIIIEKYKKLEEKCDFVLVEGSDFSGEGSVFEFDWNVNIAKNLGLPAIVVSSGVGKTMEEFISSLQLAFNTFEQNDVEVIAVAANKIQPENVEAVRKEMNDFLPDDVSIFTIPMVPNLDKPTLREITDSLKGKVVFGKEMLGNQSGSFVVGAMQLRNFLPHIKENTLVITPGDRADLIMGTLQAHISKNYPSISGMILTGGILPDRPIIQLIDGLTQVVPIISVKEGTFEVTNRIGQIQSNISAGNTSKIISSIETFQKFVSVENFVQHITEFQSNVTTPNMFQYQLVQRAKAQKKRIVLPESNDDRILTAAARFSNMDVVDVILLGNEKTIRNQVKDLGIKMNYDKIQIINPSDFERFDEYAETFYELRKHKNVNISMARDIMNDVSYFATMMIYKGDADGMVSGAAHTTQHTIRPALQFIKTKPGSSIVSSVFFMCLDDRVSVFGDCAINPNPNAQELAEIAISAADSSAAFGIEPRIAMLSYSSGSSGKGADVEKVREATEIVKNQRPDLKIEGPIQYDAAVDEGVGKSKMPDSEVAGRASVLIFPDLNTGNNTYKAVQRETGALAIGPMLLGLNKPVNDLSRGCTVDDVFNTVVLTAIQAQED